MPPTPVPPDASRQGVGTWPTKIKPSPIGGVGIIRMLACQTLRGCLRSRSGVAPAASIDLRIPLKASGLVSPSTFARGARAAPATAVATGKPEDDEVPPSRNGVLVLASNRQVHDTPSVPCRGRERRADARVALDARDPPEVGLQGLGSRAT